MSTLTWQKSSYSNEGADCLNVADTATETILLRESDEPDLIVTTTRAGLRALLLGVKAGEFDRAAN